MLARCWALLVVVVCLAVTQPALAYTYRITASVARSAPQIEGLVEVTLTNPGTRPLHDIALLLFPNRFASPDQAVDDFNRPFVYPREEFHPGWMDIPDVRIGDRVVATRFVNAAGLPARCALLVDLPSPLAPAAAVTLQVRFQTYVPERFGTFGEFQGMLTAIGGWYPYVPGLHDDGTWAVDEPPPLADFDVQLTIDPDLDVVLNGQQFQHPYPFVHTAVRAVHYLSLVAAPVFLRDEIAAGATRIIFLHRPTVHFDRRAPGPSQTRITLTALRDIVRRRSIAVPNPPAELVVVEAPLRLNLTAAGEGMVVISDRTLKVLWLLRPFHQTQLAQAVFGEFMRPALARRETARDYPWVSEGLSYEAARVYLAATQPHTRSVQEWIELFNVFSIVDRFETAPKIPFVSAFFERARSADELHDQIGTFNHDEPPGRVIFGKLQHLLGETTFRAVLDRCTSAAPPFRDCAAMQSNEALAAIFTQWLQPYPEINYDFGAVDLNRPGDDHYSQTMTIRRHADREIREPVDVRLRSIGGQTVDLRWEGNGDHGQLTAVTAQRMYQAIIDPDRKLIETTRTDNARPPTPQVVVDTAEVEISSTEFGISGLIVGRGRYDYRKDLAVAAFYTNRSVGADAGARYHWGRPNDPTLYRNNLYAFYSLQALDGSFKDLRHPAKRTYGHLNGVGVRYLYNNLFAFDNPTHEIDVRLFADWYDRGLDSDFDYVDWGGSLVLTHTLWTPRTIVAGEVFNGFSEPLGSSRVPNQGLFSLGGSRSIRGIGAEDELGRNIFILRGELRQAVYPELDLDLLDFLVLRRPQLRFFVDSGRVDNSAAAVYDPSRYAVGVGTAFAAAYDFMGFFPAMAYIEIATRVDRASKLGDVQFLFGSRQAF